MAEDKIKNQNPAGTEPVTNSVSRKEVPTGVKVIAILNYIVAGLLIITSLAFIVGGSFIGSIFTNTELGPFGAIGGGLFIFIGLIFLAFAVLAIFIGRGLWKGQNWARIVSLVFAVLGILFGLLSLISGEFSVIISLAINGLILWYLGFNKDVKAAFA